MPPISTGDSQEGNRFERQRDHGAFQRRTFEVLGARMGLQFASANGLHIFSKAVVNERLLRAVTGRWATRVAPWWICRRLGSKTASDQQLMLQRIG
jgi:hypothetical protein